MGHVDFKNPENVNIYCEESFFNYSKWNLFFGEYFANALFVFVLIIYYFLTSKKNSIRQVLDLALNKEDAKALQRLIMVSNNPYIQPKRRSI